MTAPLLATKLYIPPVRPELVSRPRLIERLNEDLHRKLTLVSAPAGFGKTTLLSEWVAGCGRPVAWVSLDKGDNDPTLFWAYFIAALQTVYPDVGAAVMAVLQAPGVAKANTVAGATTPPPIEPLLTGLINEIAEVPDPPSTLRQAPGPLALVLDDKYRAEGQRAQDGAGSGRRLVLVLDDFHVITEQQVHDGVTFLLDNMPPQMHLILSSRADPPWPLARLRARREMTELRTNDLRFTSQEAATFLNEVMKLDLSPEDVAVLEDRTEGWIAGLQMAALSMRGREDLSGFIRAFSGSHRFILDYLVEEVLDRQSNDIQEFLLKTSILEQMTAPLCDAVRFGRAKSPSSSIGTAVTDSADSQTILTQLEQASLFLVPLDDERRWHRYHRLFTDLLRSRLEQTQPDQVSTVHRRASDWYEQNGLIAEAVSHAFAAGDVERVARLVEGNALAMMDRGELTTLVAWLNALPEEMIRSRPWFCVARAWALIYTGQVDALDPLLLDAEKALLEVPANQAGLDEHVAGHIISIRAYTLILKGNMSRAAKLAREALERLPEQDLTARGWTASLLANALRWGGNLAAADQAFAEASAISRAAGDSHVAVDVLCDWAGLQIMQGQLHKAAATCRDAMALADDCAAQSGRRLPVTGYAHVRLSVVLRQWNDLEAALRHAREGIHLCEQWGWAEILVGGYVNLAKALEAIGDMDSALDAAQKARQVARGVSPWFDAYAAALEARLWLAQGDGDPDRLAAAYRWAAEESRLSVDGEPGFQYEFAYLTLARVRMAQGRGDPSRLDEAVGLLTRLLEVAQAAGAMGYVIEILVLQAMALQAQSKMDQALTALERALSLAEPQGYVRTFVDEGPPMAQLLRQAIARGIAVNYAGKLLATLEIEMKDERRMITSAPSSLVETLSERELEVLRLLPTFLSSTEIAEELFIAASTVRSHIKSIYGKLDVHTRREAVARAQDLGLL